MRRASQSDLAGGRGVTLRERAAKAESIVELLKIHSEERGDQAAYIFYGPTGEEKGRLSFAQLWAAANGTAAALAKLGCQPQTPVLLLFDQGLEFIQAYYACLVGRYIAVPSNPPRANRKSERIAGIANHCEPSCILTTQVLAQRLADSVGALPAPIFVCENLTTEIAETINELPRRSDYSLLQYTSGSTGYPKGVAVSSSNLVVNIWQRIRRWSYEFGDEQEPSTFASWLPVFHDMGLIGSVMDPCFLGTTCHLMSPTTFIQRPEVWLKVISDNKVRAAGSPDFGYKLCTLKRDSMPDLDLSSWCVAWNGAEPINGDAFAAFAAAFSSFGLEGKNLTPCYGLAEGTLMATGRGAGESLAVLRLDRAELKEGRVKITDAGDSTSFVNCGRSLDDHEILIVDPDTLNELPDYTIGEIWFKGPSVAQGYWKAPKETAEVFGAVSQQGKGPCLRTGDLGFLDPDGCLYVTGRRKDLIIVRGANHLPQDIEATVEACHPAVNETGSAAFAVQTPDGEEVGILAEIKRTALKGLAAEEVFKSIRSAVTRTHGVHVHQIGLIKPMSLPKTTSGKVQRSACRKAMEERSIELLHEYSGEKTQDGQ